MVLSSYMVVFCWHKGRLIKIGRIVLVTLVLLLAGLGAFSLYKVAADDLPLFEASPHLRMPEEEYVPDQIIVKFKPGILSEAQAQLNERARTSVVHTSPRGGFKVLQIPEGKTVAEMVDIYSRQPIVEYAEPNYIGRISPEAK